jgi:hypothetical protein
MYDAHDRYLLLVNIHMSDKGKWSLGALSSIQSAIQHFSIMVFGIIILSNSGNISVLC